MELVEAEEAVGEDDGVAGCSCICLERAFERGMGRGHTVFGAYCGVVVCDCGAEA